MLLRWVFRKATRRASTGGHWAWWLVVASAWLLQRDRDRRSEPAISFPIQPGQQVLVTMKQKEESPR